MMQNVYVLNIDGNYDNRFNECLVTKAVFEKLYNQLNDNDSQFVKIETIWAEKLTAGFIMSHSLLSTTCQYDILTEFLDTLFEDVCEVEINSLVEILENQFDTKIQASPFLEYSSTCYIFNKNSINSMDIEKSNN